MRIWGACILAVVLNAAVVTDVLTGKIRNSIIIAGFLGGIFYQLLTDGAGGVLTFTAGMVVPLIFTFPLFIWGALGAGDVKLLAVTGSFLGVRSICICMLLSFLLAGMSSLLKMLCQRILFIRLSVFQSYLKKCLLEKKLTSYPCQKGDEQAVIHMSVYILFASLICMIGGMF